MRNEIMMSFSIPDTDDLYYITAKIVINRSVNPVMTNFHHQILKTRHLINSITNLIASPSLYHNNEIDIIIEKRIYETKEAKELFQDEMVEIGYPGMVSKAILKSCLKYTLIVRLSPHWNQASKYLIEGSDFLTENGILSAVQIEVNVLDNKAYVSIYPCRIRLPKIFIDDYLVENPCYDGQYNNQQFYARSSIGSENVYVLPSLKKGKIVEINTFIPEYCPLKCYSDFKDYWFNMYGYKLPETAEHIFYYSILFFGKKFTYPDICLKRCGIVFTAQQIGLSRIVEAFLKDFRSRCFVGFLSQYSDTLDFSCINLDLQPRDNIRQITCNLIPTSPETYFNAKECGRTIISEYFAKQYNYDNVEENMYKTIFDNSCKKLAIAVQAESNLRAVTSFLNPSGSMAVATIKSDCFKTEQNNDSDTGKDATNTYVKGKPNSPLANEELSFTKPFVPIFKPMIKRNMNKSIKPVFRKIQDIENEPKMEDDSLVNLSTRSIFITASSSSTVNDISCEKQPSPYKPVFIKKCTNGSNRNGKNKSEKKSIATIVTIDNKEKKLRKTSTVPTAKRKRKNISVEEVAQERTKNYLITKLNNKKVNECNESGTAVETEGYVKNKGTIPVVKLLPMLEQVSSMDGIDAGAGEEHLIQQKKENKVKSHSIVDLETITSMIKNGKLNKVNSSSLIQFLRSKSITCRVKDRKEVLINKVKEYLESEEKNLS